MNRTQEADHVFSSSADQHGVPASLICNIVSTAFFFLFLLHQHVLQESELNLKLKSYILIITTWPHDLQSFAEWEANLKWSWLRERQDRKQDALTLLEKAKLHAELGTLGFISYSIMIYNFFKIEIINFTSSILPTLNFFQSPTPPCCHPSCRLPHCQIGKCNLPIEL